MIEFFHYIPQNLAQIRLAIQLNSRNISILIFAVWQNFRKRDYFAIHCHFGRLVFSQLAIFAKELIVIRLKKVS